MSNDERMHILQMIEDGAITAAEGLRLLSALSGQSDAAPAAASAAAANAAEAGGAEANASSAAHHAEAPQEPPIVHDTKPAPPNPNLEKWKRWWVVPLWIGIGITTLGALLMYWAYAKTGLSFWLACLSTPFALGVLVIALAAASRTAKWIHIRVKTGHASREWPRNIAISFPLPIHLTAWFLRTFGHNIPKFKDTAVDELILAMGESTTPDNPLYVEVNEGEGGERVQVYIG